VELGVNDIAKMIDISAVQTSHGENEITELMGIARTYGFAAIHILPCWVPFVKERLPTSSGIMIGAPVGFPSGGHTTEIKVMEAKRLVADGVDEMDIMICVGKLKSKAYAYVEDEIRAVVQAVSVPVKVILEVQYLSQDEVLKACELCIKAGASYVKTSTGWTGTSTSIEIVRLITSFVGNAIKIKVSGGIRNIDTIVEMYRMGVSRFGINAQASMSILDEVASMPGKRIEA
jgi:deoxyribose-phosphate aldolase